MVTRDGANFHAILIKLFEIADNYGDTIWHSETLFSNGHGVFRPPRRMLVAYSNLGGTGSATVRQISDGRFLLGEQLTGTGDVSVLPVGLAPMEVKVWVPERLLTL